MILNFSSQETQAFWNSDGRQSRPYSAFAKVAMRKLRMLDAAKTLNDLLVPPGNRLESLKGDRLGQYSIRINDKYRICFVWNEHGVTKVEIVDYH